MTTEKLQREKQARLQAWAGAGYPLRHRERIEAAARARAEAAEWHVERDAIQCAARDSAWRALQPRGGAVVLLGPRGTGKTQLAVELALQASRRGLEGFSGRQAYHVLGELFRDEKRTFGEREGARAHSPIEAAAAVELLVLDEVQERFETDWEDRELTMLFDRRYREMRRTILIANLALRDAPQKLPASMWSRLVECALVLECNWPSYRKA